ncbi:MAG: amidohydrolase [Acidimicrobiia bacterium]|nr:amidohydrolase [Acidimicrobiia bacterium]
MRTYEVISTDDHVVEPADVWESRAPASLRDRVPKIVATDDGDFWEIDGRRRPISGLSAMAGRKAEDFTAKAARFADMRPGCYDAVARLEDMDTDGVDAEILFGTLPGPAGNTFAMIGEKDSELGAFCVRAYNDWLAEDFCATDPERLIPQAILPLWDAEAAAAELVRAVELGHRGALFPGLPHAIGLPAIGDAYWTPVFAAAEECGVPLASHIGGSLARQVASELIGAEAGGDHLAAETVVATAPLSNYGALANIIFSGVLDSHPGLTIVSVESGIGWIPYFLERLDHTWERHRFWTGAEIPRRPSEYFRDNMVATFIVDDAGIAARDSIGVANIMWEVDYPHSDTTFPHSRKILEEHFGHLPPEERHAIVAGNAMRVFGLGNGQGSKGEETT